MPEQSVAKEIVGSRRANGVPKSEGVFGIVFACERNATLLLASNAKKKGEDSKTTICLSFNIYNPKGPNTRDRFLPWSCTPQQT